jgi:hypothetical protein
MFSVLSAERSVQKWSWYAAVCDNGLKAQKPTALLILLSPGDRRTPGAGGMDARPASTVPA